MGESAVLAEVTDLDAVLALTQQLNALRDSAIEPWVRVVDIVPAALSVLVTVGVGESVTAVRDALVALACDPLPDPARPGVEGAPDEVVEITVRYDGPDLADVARLTGLTEAGVVAAHTGMPWRVGFGGFAPGFAYLVGGDPRLNVARRDVPRTAVPRGAVALAGDYSGIYPRESPGGWQLIGSTDATLWDEGRDPPALLVPGAMVRFVAIEQPDNPQASS